jgi:arsenate-mycothiol transferase
MAQALMWHTAGGRINAQSAGTHAKNAVNRLSAQVLAENGIDVSAHTPTQLDDALIDAADLIVILGREAHIDDTAGTPLEHWDTDEPSLRGIDGIERMRLIRDDIATRVHNLADETLQAPTSGRDSLPSIRQPHSVRGEGRGGHR